ncbi:alpha/beta hydrolase family protein [Pararobbsia silviterrae]|uniref:S9 family peptidase n=1 Tax=Pararobbsia silviterrae TaxID=1792498 RepID=A0A494X3W9_9BURK|nr:alpha/beta fold hydrolase [Pararobbsia silviterrae]RKP45040.1 S9 family peptidase [Pararobbsia silviterrae]
MTDVSVSKTPSVPGVHDARRAARAAESPREDTRAAGAPPADSASESPSDPSARAANVESPKRNLVAGKQTSGDGGTRIVVQPRARNGRLGEAVVVFEGAPDARVTLHGWLGDSNLLVRAPAGASQVNHVWKVSSDGRTRVDMTAALGDVSRVRIVDRGASLLVYATDLADGKTIKRYLVDASTFEARDTGRALDVEDASIEESGEDARGLRYRRDVADRNGVVRVTVEGPQGFGKVVYRSAADAPYRVIARPNFYESFVVLGFTQDNKRLIVRSNIETDRVVLAEFDPELGKQTRILFVEPGADVTSAVMKEDGDGTAVREVLTMKNGRERQRIVDPAFKRVHDAVAQKLGDGKFTLTVPDFEAGFCRVDADGSRGPSVWLYDIARDRLVQIARPKGRDVPSTQSVKRPIQFRARDGLRVSGYFSAPQRMPTRGGTGGPPPMVVLVHSGPFASDGAGYDEQVQWFTSRGYAVLQVNYRGSSDYGKAFARAGDRQWGRAMQTDLADGVDYVLRRGWADGRRVAIMGLSYGGYAALAGATLDPKRYAAAISIGGLSDLAKQVVDIDVSPEQKAFMYERHGDPGNAADMTIIHDTSPLNFAERVKHPVLLMHARRDPAVPVSHSERMAEALRTAGKSVETMFVDRDTHAVDDDMYPVIEAFLAKHLARRAGKPATDGSKVKPISEHRTPARGSAPSAGAAIPSLSARPV